LTKVNPSGTLSIPGLLSKVLRANAVNS